MRKKVLDSFLFDINFGSFYFEISKKIFFPFLIRLSSWFHFFFLRVSVCGSLRRNVERGQMSKINKSDPGVGFEANTTQAYPSPHLPSLCLFDSFEDRCGPMAILYISCRFVDVTALVIIGSIFFLAA